MTDRPLCAPATRPCSCPRMLKGSGVVCKEQTVEGEYCQYERKLEMGGWSPQGDSMSKEALTKQEKTRDFSWVWMWVLIPIFWLADRRLEKLQR